MSQLSLSAGNLGQLDIIGGILGPIVEGGVASYGIYAQSKAQKDQLKQRKLESQQALMVEHARLAQEQILTKKRLAAQERMHYQAQTGAVQRAQIASHYTAKTIPYGVAVAALLGAALVAVAVTK